MIFRTINSNISILENLRDSLPAPRIRWGNGLSQKNTLPGFGCFDDIVNAVEKERTPLFDRRASVRRRAARICGFYKVKRGQAVCGACLRWLYQDGKGRLPWRNFVWTAGTGSTAFRRRKESIFCQRRPPCARAADGFAAWSSESGAFRRSMTCGMEKNGRTDPYSRKKRLP